MRKSFGCSLWLCLAAGMLMASSAKGQVVQGKVNLGFEGHYKTGAWVPLKVTFQNFGGEVRGKVSVTPWEWMHGQPKELRHYIFPVHLPAGQARIFHLTARIPDNADGLLVRLEWGDRVLWQEGVEVQFARFNEILLILTSQPQRFSHMQSRVRGARRRREQAVLFFKPEQLPTRWQEYESVDVVIWDDVSFERLRGARRQMLLGWLHQGGALLVTAKGIEVNRNSPMLRQLMPWRIGGKRLVKSPASLCAYLDVPPNLVEEAKVISCAASGRAVAVTSKGVPLLLRREVGRGEVVFVLFDLPSLRYADERKADWFERLVLTMAVQERMPRFPFGEQDRLFLVPSSERTLPQVPWLLGLTIACVLGLGPMSYLILKRLDKREFLILAAPALAMLFLLASFLIQQILKPKTPRLVAASSAFVGNGERFAAIQAFLGVLSPAWRRHSFRIDHPKATVKEDFEDDFDAARRVGNFPIEIHPGKSLSVSDIELHAHSMRFFDVDAVHDFGGAIEGRVKLAGSTLTGSVVNRLPFPLERAYLLLRWNAVPLGNLMPGQQRTFSLPLTPPPEYAPPLSWLTKEEGQRGEFLDYLFKWNAAQFEHPVLIGWYEKPPLPLRLNEASFETQQFHLLVCRLPLHLQDKVLNLPQGTIPRLWMAGESPRDFWLYGYSKEGQGIAFDLPFTAERLAIDELTCHVSVGKEHYTGDDFPYDLFVYDWEKDNWQLIAKEQRRAVSLRLSPTGNFVRLPSGIVQVRVAPSHPTGEFERLALIEHIDLSFRGRREQP